MDQDELTRGIRTLVDQLELGAPVLEALHDEALRLLDDHEDELSPAMRAFLEDARFAFYDLGETRSASARREIIARLVATGRVVLGE